MPLMRASMSSLPGATGVHHAPNSSLPQASAVITPRQLAPTVGHAAALAGISIWMGNVLPSGERIVSGLMQRLGNLFVVNNTGGVTKSGVLLPLNGGTMFLGDIEIYVVT